MNNIHLSSEMMDFNGFMAKHSAKNTSKNNNNNNNNNNNDQPPQPPQPQPITHTRIAGLEFNIYPGSYIIPKEELNTFYNLYYNHVFVKSQSEYLTEKQLEKKGPIVIDFDFKYDVSTVKRQHTKNHVVDIVCEYLDTLKEFYVFTKDVFFPVFIFEKPNVNKLNDKTKDGIHMLIGIQSDHIIQQMLREKMIPILTETCSDLPLINDWAAILDEGISKGYTNWQLFGSRKPGNEAYELTQHYIINYDESDGNFQMNERKVAEYNLKENFAKLSVQYEDNPKFEINPKIMAEYTRLENKNVKIKKSSSKTKLKLISDEDELLYSQPEHLSINDIKDKDTLNTVVDAMLNKLKQDDKYDHVAIHSYTQALSSKYYEPGSHVFNRMVAFALKNTDERLFLSWVLLRSKASDFDYDTIPALFIEWSKMNKSNSIGKSLTKKSIKYWLQNENPELFEQIKSSTIDYYIENSIEAFSDHGSAQILLELHGENFVCVSYDKKGIWYNFRDHRWVLDKGHYLRGKISKDLFNIYGKKAEQYEAEMAEYQEDDDRRQFLKKKAGLIHQIKIKLKTTTHKDHIMREASELFYDEYFVKNMDSNKYLLCFNNGVVDFKTKTFRPGYPSDYITKCTNVTYVHYNETDTEWKKMSDELIEFMKKLFPIPDLNKYMWDHLSSCLIGTNKNQTFNVYHGSGSNGKSLLTDLMSATLGEYKGTVPINLVTDMRGKIGGTSDEILKLKSIRYAVMQEPSKNVKLNEGVMKELTGGDPIQARGLYAESETFEPQFSLVVCTNNLFDIDSNDDGTWRRIRKCPFPSKFVDDDESYEHATPFVFKKDKSLSDKLRTFAPVFASMLVKIAFETGGIVTDCNTVIDASKSYRSKQDRISCFITDKIKRTGDNTKKGIMKTTLLEEFQLWYQQEHGSKKFPKGEELYESMNKKFGDYNKKNGWVGTAFIKEDDEDEEDIINQV